MSTSSGQQEASGRLSLSRAALKALGELPDIIAGPLSPLARIQTPPESADKAGLIAALEGMGDPWRSAVPALIDPGVTIMVMVGDAIRSLMGQYLLADASGAQPGFRLNLDGPLLSLSGPVTLDEVQLSLLDALSLSGVAKATPARLNLTADQFWALVALVDAYMTAAARRRVDRQAGPPPGFRAGEIAAAWRAGLAGADPSWSVTLFSLLNPDAVPAGFEERLPAVMKEMADSGLLGILEGPAGAAVDDIYVPGIELDALCRSLALGATNFGLVYQYRASAARVEASILGGWRTGRGIWIADISSLPGGSVDLSVCDTRLFLKLMEQVFQSPGGQSAEPVVPGGYSLEMIMGLLQGQEPPVTAASPGTRKPSFCPACGKGLQSGAVFCVYCGSKTPGA